MMRSTQVSALCDRYLKKLGLELGKPQKLTSGLDAPLNGVYEALQRQHIAWMLHQIRSFADKAEAARLHPIHHEIAPNDKAAGLHEKAQRWLGFVQGWLTSNGHYTINDLREHVRGY